MIWNDLCTTLFWILKETKNKDLGLHFLDKLRGSFLNVYPTPPLIRIYPLLTINVYTKFHSTNNTAKNVKLLVSSASWLQRFASFLCVNRCCFEYSGNVFNRERWKEETERKGPWVEPNLYSCSKDMVHAVKFFKFFYQNCQPVQIFTANPLIDR